MSVIAEDMAERRQPLVQPRAYMNPYLAGVGLGLVLLAAFVMVGRGLGASGAFSSVLAVGVSGIDAEYASRSLPYSAYLGDGSSHPLKDWLVFEIAGVLFGGLLSAIQAGRFRITVDQGPRSSNRTRLTLALVGGVLMGIGAKLARGCTSGQALTGGAMLSVGSWLFILCAFAAAYAVAPLMKKQWT